MVTVKEFKEGLSSHSGLPIRIVTPACHLVPDHFHVTEVGRVHKTFVDCGGTKRESVSCMLQVWTANDVEHRLNTDKLLKIMNLGASILGSEDMPVEVEYGQEVAAQYVVFALRAEAGVLNILLVGKQTDCLAPDKCGVTGCC